jgi:hypothetical protein
VKNIYTLMARRDNTHEIVKAALEREGWIISHDPLLVKIGKKSAQIDLGAEKLIIAEKESEKIAVEIKSFIALSALTDYYHALGQFMLYKMALQNQEPDRTLYLAIPSDAYEELSNDIFDYPEYQQLRHNLIIYDNQENISLLWIK